LETVALTITLYSPGWRGEITDNPASLVCLVVSKPVATLLITTLAPGIAPPAGSLTVTLMAPPLPAWASAIFGIIKKQTFRIMNKKTIPAPENF